MSHSRSAILYSVFIHFLILSFFRIHFAAPKPQPLHQISSLQIEVSKSAQTFKQTAQKKVPETTTDRVQTSQSARSSQTDLMNAYLTQVWTVIEKRIHEISHSRSRVSGTLKVRLVLLQSGQIKQVEFISGEKQSRLRELTLEALNKDKFLPQFPSTLVSLSELKVVLPIEVSAPF